MSTLYTQIATSLGSVFVTSENGSLTRIFLDGSRRTPSVGSDWLREDRDPLLSSAVRQISEYLEGRRQAFDLPVNPVGTPFQKQVWNVLQRIPYGKTISYRDVARLLGKNDRYLRAVGSAIARNPLMLIVPCHRVIGSDGSLTGYAGGLDRKKDLLERERHASAEKNLPSP